MTNAEMLAKLLQQSGWTITTESDEDGDRICRPESEEDKAE